MVVEVGIARDQVLYPLAQFAPFSLHIPARYARPERRADQIVQVQRHRDVLPTVAEQVSGER
jgi:hypothetical protein